MLHLTYDFLDSSYDVAIADHKTILSDELLKTLPEPNENGNIIVKTDHPEVDDIYSAFFLYRIKEHFGNYLTYNRDNIRIETDHEILLVGGPDTELGESEHAFTASSLPMYVLEIAAKMFIEATQVVENRRLGILSKEDAECFLLAVGDVITTLINAETRTNFNYGIKNNTFFINAKRRSGYEIRVIELNIRYLFTAIFRKEEEFYLGHVFTNALQLREKEVEVTKEMFIYDDEVRLLKCLFAQRLPNI